MRGIRAVGFALLVVLSTVSPLGVIGLATAATVSGCTTISTGGSYELDADVTNEDPVDSSPWCVRITASNVVFDGNGHTIDGTYDFNGDESGVYVAPGLSNVTVRNVTVSDWSKGGVTVEGSTGVLVTDVTTSGSGYGVYVTGSSDVDVTNVEGDGHVVKVEDSSYVDVTDLGTTPGGSTEVYYLNSNHSVVSDSTIEGSGSDDGITVEDGTNVTVRNATINNTDSGVWFEDSSYGTVTESDVRNSTKGVSVTGYFSDHAVVAGNTFVDNGEGVYVNDASDGQVRNNTFSRNFKGVEAELYNYEIDGLVVSDNVIEDGSRNGILLNGQQYTGGAASLRDVVLSNNTATNNGREGVVLYSTTNVTMRDNQISGHEVNFQIGEEPDASDHSIVHFRHDVDASNTVAGAPIRYYRNASGVVVDGSTPAGTVVVVDSSDVTVRDQTFENESVVFANAVDSRAENVTIQGTGLDVRYSDNVTVDGAVLRPTTSNYNLDDFGVRVAFSTDVTVADSVAGGVAYGAIVGETGGVSEGTTFQNFTASSPSLLGWGMSIDHANGTRVVESNLSDDKYGVDVGADASNTTIEATTVSDNDRAGYGYGIEVKGDDTTIRNSTVGGNAEFGIDVVTGFDSVLADNVIVDNGEQGILVSNGRSTVVEGNDVRNNGYRGIDVDSRFDDANGHTVVDNVVAGNVGSGIVIEGFGNYLENNTVRNHDVNADDAGIDVSQGATNLTIVGGTLDTNSYGLLLGGTSSSRSIENVTVEGVALANGTVGLYQQYVTNGTYRNLSFDGSDEWAFYAADASGESNGNSVEDATIDGNVTASWSGEEVAVRGVTSPPANPDDSANVSAYLNVSRTTSAGYANLSVSYDEGDAGSVDQSILRLWVHDGTAWSQVSGRNVVDTVANVVSANVTTSGIVAPLETPNAEPIAVEDAYATTVNQSLTISAPGPLLNDYDEDDDSLVVAAIGSSPSHGSFTSGPTSTGSLTYTPDAGFVGTDSFTYSAKDPMGAQSSFVNVTVEVLPDPNRGPEAIEDRYSTFAGDTLSVSAPGLLANDGDPDGDSITVVAIGSSPTDGSLTSSLSDGSFQYQPDPNFVGTDSFSYSIEDANGNQSAFVDVTVEVLPDPNRVPTIVEDWFVTEEGQTLAVGAPGLLRNDEESDGDSITVVAIGSSPTHGALPSSLSDGSFQYQPDPNFVGTDTFSYSIEDANGNQSAFVDANVVVVDGTGNTPTAVVDEFTTDEGQNLSVGAPGLLRNDYDPNGDPLTVAAIGSSPSDGNLSVLTGGSFEYEPDPGFSGTDTFTYSAKDGNGTQSSFVTVTVHVQPDPNREPEAIEDRYSAFGGQNLSVSAPGLLGNDGEPDGDSMTVAAIGSSPTNGNLSVLTDGSLEYEPDPGFSGTDTFTYSAKDAGGAQSPFVTATVEVLPDPNRAPTALADEFRTASNGTLTLGAPGLTQNDYDLDGDTFTVAAIGSSPTNGSLTSSLSDGSFTYVPDPGFVGTDTFTYSVKDANGSQSTWVTVSLGVGEPASDGSSGSGGSGDGGQSGGDGSSGGSGDSGGSSSGGGSSGGDSTSSSSPVVTSSGSARTTTTTDGTSVSVRVSGASSGDSVDVRMADDDVDRTFAEDGGALEGLTATFDADGDFDMDVSYSADPPSDGSEPPSGPGLGYISVDHDASDELVGEVTFGFRVSAELLASRGVDPSDAVLYRDHDGEWTALETELVETGDGFYRFRATSPGLSVFAIGVRTDDGSSPADATTEPTHPGSTSTSAERGDRPTGVETTAPTTARTTADGGQPGFGAVAVLLALLAIILAASRRRE